MARLLPPSTLDWAKFVPSLGTSSQLAEFVANWKLVDATPAFLQTFEPTRRSILSSVSIPSLYSPIAAKDKQAKPSSAEGARADRSAEAFFDRHAVEVTTVPQLLKTLATFQSKQARHRRIWRAQKAAALLSKSGQARNPSRVTSRISLGPPVSRVIVASISRSIGTTRAVSRPETDSRSSCATAASSLS
jgi:hypothetical protein